MVNNSCRYGHTDKLLKLSVFQFNREAVVLYLTHYTSSCMRCYSYLILSELFMMSFIINSTKGYGRTLIPSRRG